MQWDSDEEREFIEDEMRDLDLQMKEDGEDLLERIETDNDYLKVQQEEDDERFETEVEHYNIQAKEPSRIKVLGSEDKVVAKLRSYQKKAENKTANPLGK
jgi:hypothetical protein